MHWLCSVHRGRYFSLSAALFIVYIVPDSSFAAARWCYARITKYFHFRDDIVLSNKPPVNLSEVLVSMLQKTVFLTHFSPCFDKCYKKSLSYVKTKQHHLYSKNNLVPPAMCIAELAFLPVNWILLLSFHCYNHVVNRTKSQGEGAGGKHACLTIRQSKLKAALWYLKCALNASNWKWLV